MNLLAVVFLVVQYVAADGRVAMVHVQPGLTPEQCAVFARARDWKPHLELRQHARCVEKLPPDSELFKHVWEA